MQNSRIYIGLSGGVDSAVASALLSSYGYEVKGIYANCYYDTEQCRNSADLKDAEAVASQLGMSLQVADYRKEYYEKVLEQFYREINLGRTPNPDILCNSEIKFGILLEDIIKGDPGSKLATGHYARLKNVEVGDIAQSVKAGSSPKGPTRLAKTPIYRDILLGRKFIFSGLDDAKDQSYFLYKIYDKAENLAHIVFPLGDYKKVEVRKLAKKFGLKVYAKVDSQGICFVGNVKLKDFIKDKITPVPGEVIGIDGRKIGVHEGSQFYTLGQRHGYRIFDTSKGPYYIVDKIPEKNLIVAGNRDDAGVKKFQIDELCFPYEIDKCLDLFPGLSVRVRNLGRKTPCEVNLLKDGKAEILLKEFEFGVSPGQSAVFYLGDLMLGGGVISSVVTSYRKNLF